MPEPTDKINSIRSWFEAHLWINTRIGFIQRWAHRNGFCHVEKCKVGDDR